jgi:ribosomal protein S18 acetylase RimI-like enzyme
MEIMLRRAQPSDLHSLLEFEQGIITTERPFDPTLAPDPVHYYDLEAMITQEHVDLVVAEYKGRIVASGYARIEEAKPYNDHELYAYLGFMFVDPEFRGQGINGMMLEKLKELVRARGITEMRLDVYAENEGAIRAYEKAGFKPLLVHMRLPIQDAELI